MTSFQEKVEEIATTVSDLGKSMFCWANGLVPPDRVAGEQDDLVKINFVFFYLAVPVGKRVIARKVAGSRVPIGQNMKIVFSTNLLRSKDKVSGQKRVILPKDMRVTEEACPAGQAKEMRFGTRPYEMCEQRKSDCGMVEVMWNMVRSQMPHSTERPVFPKVYLGAYSMEDFNPRNDGRLIELLKNSPAYKEMGGVQENFSTCFHDCFEKGPEDRFLIDYQLVGGKGIPYLDLGTLHPAYILTGDPLKIDYEDDVYVLDVEYSINKILSKESHDSQNNVASAPG